MRLAGKVALITGAAAGVEGEVMGFGGAAARLFAQNGAKVVLTDILEDKGQRTAEQIQAVGGDVTFVRLDVTSEEDWQEAVQTAVSRYDGLHVMVNNAGTAARKRIEETTVDVWDGQMDVHAKGVFLGTKFAIPEMRKAGGGSIINISSIYGIVGSPYSTAYHAAKGAIRTFTKTAAIQLAGDNIRVNSIHPVSATRRSPTTATTTKSGATSGAWTAPLSAAWATPTTSLTACCIWHPTSPAMSPAPNWSSTAA